MDTQEFESSMNALLPGLNPEAMKILISYAEELDRDGTEPKEVFFKETYVEYYLVNQHYGKEIAQQLFDLSETFTLNPFEIRGAAIHLRDGVNCEKIAQMAIDGLCEREGLEWQESSDALKAFEENRLDISNGMMLEKSDKDAIQLPVTWDMIAEKLDQEMQSIKSYSPPNTDPALLSYFRVATTHIHRCLKERQVPADLYEVVYKQDKILGAISHHWMDEAKRRGGDTRDKRDIAAISVDNWMTQVRQKQSVLGRLQELSDMIKATSPHSNGDKNKDKSNSL